MSTYVAAYDISDDVQRARVARVLGTYGDRIQFSVFIVNVPAAELPRFRLSVGRYLGDDDDFDLLPVDTSPQRKRLSWKPSEEDIRSVVVIE